MTLRIATWNVNSLRQRLDHLARFTEESRPDILCLQEIKVTNEDFPADFVRGLGLPFVGEERRVWCGIDDRRHAAIRLEGGLEIHNFYVPSGGPTPDPEANDKFAHKLRFLTEMAEWAWNHKKLLRSVGHTPLESAHMERLLAAADFLDVPRHFTPPPTPLYSWWGYRFAQSVAKNYGWRLDHVLVSPPLASAVEALQTVKQTRTWEKPSDHVPVVLDLS
jgi:exodeoxyribonuclease-3